MPGRGQDDFGRTAQRLRDLLRLSRVDGRREVPTRILMQRLARVLLGLAESGSMGDGLSRARMPQRAQARETSSKADGLPPALEVLVLTSEIAVRGFGVLV